MIESGRTLPTVSMGLLLGFLLGGDPISPGLVVFTIAEPAMGVFDADALLNHFARGVVLGRHENELSIFWPEPAKFCERLTLLQLLPVPGREKFPKLLELRIDRRR